MPSLTAVQIVGTGAGPRSVAMTNALDRGENLDGGDRILRRWLGSPSAANVGRRANRDRLRRTHGDQAIVDLVVGAAIGHADLRRRGAGTRCYHPNVTAVRRDATLCADDDLAAVHLVRHLAAALHQLLSGRVERAGERQELVGVRDPEQFFRHERVDCRLAEHRGHRCCWLLCAR